MSVEKYKIGKKAVGRYKLESIEFGSVDVTPPVVSATDVGTATAEVPDLAVTDKILVMMQEDAPKTAIPVAAYCSAAGVLTVQFANITSGTATAAAKEFLWVKSIP